MNPESLNQPESYDTLYNNAVAIAQGISQKWSRIPKGDRESWRFDDAELSMIYDMGSKEVGGKTGIQVFFESRMRQIETEDEQNKNHLIHRLIDDLKRFQERIDDII